MVMVCLMAVTVVSPVSAELPSQNVKEWFGYFVGYKSRAYQFGVASHGKVDIKVLNKQGGFMSSRLIIPVNFAVEETLPDGKTVTHGVKPESFESSNPSGNLNKVVIRAKVKGDAIVEIFLDEDQGAVLLGGKIVERGALTNPLRFVATARIPDLNYSEKEAAKKQGKKPDEKENKKRDREDDNPLQLFQLDGKRKKVSMKEAVNAGELSGAGFKALQLESSEYKGRKFEFSAMDQSQLMLENPATAPLSEGFTIKWFADPVKDPTSRARLKLLIK
jgi:hypothetical protein